MAIYFFNRFFYPDPSATSQVLADLAFHLARTGAEVHIVTSRLPQATATIETIDSVTVHRVAKATTDPHSLFDRALAYARFYQGARDAARRLLRPGDVVVLKTDPPLLSAAVAPVAKRRGAKVVAWLQDVFPEI